MDPWTHRLSLFMQTSIYILRCSRSDIIIPLVWGERGCLHLPCVKPFYCWFSGRWLIELPKTTNRTWSLHHLHKLDYMMILPNIFALCCNFYVNLLNLPPFLAHTSPLRGLSLGESIPKVYIWITASQVHVLIIYIYYSLSIYI